MESNFNLAYKDTAPAKPLTKAVLNKMVLAFSKLTGFL